MFDRSFCCNGCVHWCLCHGKRLAGGSVVKVVFAGVCVMANAVLSTSFFFITCAPFTFVLP